MNSDSGEVLANGDKSASQKRKLKTPAQLMALENFYNEHKYPTEELKAKLANEIGITEKQLSGWFCHRRLKDKRSLKEVNNTIRSQDRSSVVLQDRVQDSCGSTKQTDYPNSKLKDVVVHDDDGDSEDSTSSERNDDVIQTPPHRPSGYLKVKGGSENVAITMVKRQLGREYQEDGPPLKVDFDPLPPLAFEPRINVHEPIYVGNKKRYESPYLTGTKKSFIPRPVSDHKPKMQSPQPYLEDDDDDDDDDMMVGMVTKQVNHGYLKQVSGSRPLVLGGKGQMNRSGVEMLNGEETEESSSSMD